MDHKHLPPVTETPTRKFEMRIRISKFCFFAFAVHLAVAERRRDEVEIELYDLNVQRNSLNIQRRKT